jgi:GNAT superfamily N-acetyltransferase
MPGKSRPGVSGRLAVRPVTADTWQAMAALFSARGAPHYCWCTPYRFSSAQHMDGDEKREGMRALVTAGTPVGVLAFAGDEPVGWCSIAPRESYVRLARSRTMPRVTELPTWTVLCFFVPRARRGTGVTSALLAGAVRYASAQGAVEIEGYPYDTAGISSTHRGRSEVFAGAGFVQEGKRWVWRAKAARARPTRR